MSEHPNFCFRCGSALQADMDYCPKCGLRIKGDEGHDVVMEDRAVMLAQMQSPTQNALTSGRGLSAVIVVPLIIGTGLVIPFLLLGPIAAVRFTEFLFHFAGLFLCLSLVAIFRTVFRPKNEKYAYIATAFWASFILSGMIYIVALFSPTR